MKEGIVNLKRLERPVGLKITHSWSAFNETELWGTISIFVASTSTILSLSVSLALPESTP